MIEREELLQVYEKLGKQERLVEKLRVELQDIADHSVAPFTNDWKFFAYINDVAKKALELKP